MWSQSCADKHVYLWRHSCADISVLIVQSRLCRLFFVEAKPCRHFMCGIKYVQTCALWSQTMQTFFWLESNLCRPFFVESKLRRQFSCDVKLVQTNHVLWSQNCTNQIKCCAVRVVQVIFFCGVKTAQTIILWSLNLCRHMYACQPSFVCICIHTLR